MIKIQLQWLQHYSIIIRIRYLFGETFSKHFRGLDILFRTKFDLIHLEMYIAEVGFILTVKKYQKCKSHSCVQSSYFYQNVKK